MVFDERLETQHIQSENLSMGSLAKRTRVDPVKSIIFSWLAPPARIPQDLIPWGLDPWNFRWTLCTIQQVCHAWHGHVKELAARYAAHTWQLHEPDPAAYLIQRLSPHPPSSHVVQVQIVLLSLSQPLVDGPDLCAVLDAIRFGHGGVHALTPSAYWTNVFLSCPALVRLDLSCAPYPDELLGAILDVASTCCPHVQSLVLPIRTIRPSMVRCMDEGTILDLLARVLPKWTISNGGLRQLVWPWYGFGSPAAHRRFLAIVAASCPRIRFLRDWTKRMPFGSDDLRRMFYAGNLFDVDFETWRFACETLPELEDWHWRIPPEGVRFLEAFAASRRPRLHRMDLGYSQRHILLRSYEPLSRELVGAFFHATPNLKAFSLVADEYSEVRQDWTTPHDRIVEMVATHCPLLVSLCIDVHVDETYRTLVPAVTDVGIRAIVHLHQLRQLWLEPVSITGTGIVVLLDACVARQLHDVEIALYPAASVETLAERALGYLLDLDTRSCSARPRFVLAIHRTADRRPTNHTRTRLQVLASDLHDKRRAIGHDVRAGLEVNYAVHFTVRWNFRADCPAPEWRHATAESERQQWHARRLHVA